MSQKFYNILIMRGKIWQLMKVRWTTLDCENSSSPDTLQVCLCGLKYNLRIHGFRTTWPCLIIKVLVMQGKISWTIQLLLCDQLHLLLILVTSVVLWLSSNLQNVSSQIRLYYTFISAAFKSHAKWSNA